MHTDDGHGWLRVTIGEVTMLGFNVTDFSKYSYRRGEDLYLEEDCDASRFVVAYRRRYGNDPEIGCNHFNGSSPIRHYARIK
jgi:hypothetical protein